MTVTVPKAVAVTVNVTVKFAVTQWMSEEFRGHHFRTNPAFYEVSGRGGMPKVVDLMGPPGLEPGTKGFA
jgi:hypothetical protein